MAAHPYIYNVRGSRRTGLVCSKPFYAVSGWAALRVALRRYAEVWGGQVLSVEVVRLDEQGDIAGVRTYRDGEDF